MSHDEEAAREMVDERDFASPTRQGTFGEDHLRHGPRRTETGFTSTGQWQNIHESRPSSLVGSIASNATNARRPQSSQSRAETDTRHAARPASLEQPSITPASRVTSFNHADMRPETRSSSSKAPAPNPDIPIDPSNFVKRSTYPPGAFQAANDGSNAPPTTTQGVDDIWDDEWGHWLVRQFHDDLFNLRRDPKAEKKAEADGKEKGRTPARLKINLAGLNRMRMRKLQVKLVQKVLHMRYKETEPQGWEGLLKQYITASKDYDYIRTCVDRKLDDPFVVITERMVDNGVLGSLLNYIPAADRLPDHLDIITATTFDPPVEKEAQPIGGTRLERTQKQKFENFITRLVFGLVGGIFLVAPMWLMVLNNTKYTALVSTTVFVLAWGVLAAWKLGDSIAVLSTTAAYAAVLVVFVGTNSDQRVG